MGLNFPGGVEKTMVNRLRDLEIVPHEAPGGAEVRGVDWLEPISESLAKALKQAWSDVCVVVAFAARYTPTLPLRYRAPILNLR